MVKTFNRFFTTINRTLRTDKKNEWVVIHYVGAVSTAENNAKYFHSTYRGASAHYFVDENSIWQVVEDKDNAWHVGGAKTYYNGARNSNSIGIEMCCKYNGEWYIEEDTLDNTAWLASQLLKKYNLPLERLTTHYLTTHKVCPEPFVRKPELWEEFKRKVEKYMADVPEVSLVEKINKIKEVMNIDDSTIQYNKFYKYGVEYIDKQYKVCVDAEKYRKGLK